MARGGYREPSSPAPVSGPGAHSARTDTGPADMVAAGGRYGERKALEAQQSAAPVVTGGGAPSVGPGSGPAPAPPMNAFGPTERPGEPITAGTYNAPGTPPDVELALRALYALFPTPYIGSLLNG